MEKPRYRLEHSGEFVIENYNNAKAFSSFFPGIAGLYGIPMWVFYVNRGQCIASFGTKDKSGAILEFYPANQSYNLTSIKGFRTFIRSDHFDKVYEPFRGQPCAEGRAAQNRMIFNPSMLRLEEENPEAGLKTEVSYITVPEEPFAALGRMVVLTNISDKFVHGEMIDGLPHVIPYGMNEWLQKHMSRTIEAWMYVDNLDKKVPFYALKTKPEDTPELEHVDRGNFYLAVAVSQDTPCLADVIVDPDGVFGRDGDICFPAAFANSGSFVFPRSQRTQGKTPCAFGYSKFSLRPQESFKIFSLIGNADTPARINSRLGDVLKEDFFARKLRKNEEIIGRLENSAFVKSSSNEFDRYARQTFLDNLLRGGFPHSIETPSGKRVFHIYGRKHGDLERDYNNFSLVPSYFSQGNGAYRDMDQNRRNDVLFNPDVAEENIATFVNALQPDGFNPLQIYGSVFVVEKKGELARILREHIAQDPGRRKALKFLSSHFTPGEFIFYLQSNDVHIRKGADAFLRDVLSVSRREDVIVPGEGYWIDHWTYNLDLIESFLAVYPERLRELLIGKKTFTFYDTWNRVMPRSDKYVRVKGKIRQYGAVTEDHRKKGIIESRKSEPHKVRARHGKGAVYRTSLFVKLVSLAANKIASLDPAGIGVEMEANKPGWCDSLNNLPGIFGSSVSETAELLRLAVFIKGVSGKLGLSGGEIFMMPEEIAGLARGLSALLKASVNTKTEKGAFAYWDKSASLKEGYRARVWMGFSGKEKAMSAKEVLRFIDLCILKTGMALEEGTNKKTGIPYTYFFHEAKKYKVLSGNKARALVRILSFRNVPVPYFLEGPAHMMKIMGDGKKKKRLYDAVRASDLYDKKLQMYKINAPLAGMPSELGRSMVFTPGWLENESVFLHMEYKYLLEVLRAGLYDEFFADIKTALVPFMRPDVYGRSILENSSFIASSAHPDSAIHGSGFVARLSGSTTEFLSMLLFMALGKAPFRVDEKGELVLSFEPALPGWLFTEKDANDIFYFDGDSASGVTIPKDSFAFAFLGKVLVIYHNPQRKDTYGADRVKPGKIVLKGGANNHVEINGGVIPSEYALSVRNGEFSQIEIHLA